MKKEKNLILEYRSDFNDCVEVINDEPATAVTNAPHKAPTIEEDLANIHKRLNILASFVGMPYVAHLNEGIMTLYPARKGDVKKVSPEAVSYVVNLQPFRDKFTAVRFKAMNSFSNEEDIVRGIIIDDDGNVERECDNRYCTSNPWTRMPITEKSSYLIATLPSEDGKPLWIPERVEFLPHGLAQDVAEVADDIINDTIELENRITPLAIKCERFFAKNE